MNSVDGILALKNDQGLLSTESQQIVFPAGRYVFPATFHLSLQHAFDCGRFGKTIDIVSYLYRYVFNAEPVTDSSVSNLVTRLPVSNPCKRVERLKTTASYFIFNR